MKRTRSPSKETLTEQAYRKIEEAILNANLAPGTWVTEPIMMKRLGIGRTPIREAVQRLALKGFVEVLPGRGIRVADVNPQDQIHILELRRAIEDLLVRRAIRHGTPAEKEEMRGLGQQLKKAAQITDAMRFRELDTEFKRLLLLCAKHKYAEGAISPLWSATSRFIWVYRTLENKADYAELVRRLIDAIVSANAAEAMHANAARMDHLEEFVRATLNS